MSTGSSAGSGGDRDRRHSSRVEKSGRAPARARDRQGARPRWRSHLTLRNLPGVLLRWLRIWFLMAWLVFRWVWISLTVREPRALIFARAHALRDFLERAGGAWIKLGQLLAMRIDFFPPEMVDVLSSLLDRIPPFPFAVARRILEEDLGRPLEDLFTEFPEKTIAAASFGQVYRAVRRSGEVVAVKVQRPNLRTIIAADTVSLGWLAFWVDSLRLLGSLRLGSQVAQLKQILEEELDYDYEAENIRRALAVSGTLPIMKIPRLHEDLLGPRVLTMEFLSGRWMNEILARLRNEGEAGRRALEREGLDLVLVAKRMFDIGMRQIFDVRTFHADPHAANIVVVDLDVVGYVDFGIAGTMDDDLAEKQERYFQAIKDERVADAAQAMTEMVEVPERRRHLLPEFRTNLEAQVRRWLREAKEGTIEDKSSARLLLSNIALVREFGFNLISGAMRYYRALIISDVIILQLDPDFDFVYHLRRYFRRRQLRRLREWSRPERLQNLTAEYAELFLNGPGLMRRLQEGLRAGGEAIVVGTRLFDRVFFTLSLSSLAGLVAVLAARALGVHDVGAYLSSSLHVDWKLAAAGFFVLWRGFGRFVER